MIQHKILLLCSQSEICRLIEKSLSGEEYKLTYKCGSSLDKDSLGKLELNFDCIILDDELDSELREMVKVKFCHLPIVCLPSLNLSVKTNNGVKYISEPFRLSELAVVLKEIFRA